GRILLRKSRASRRGRGRADPARDVYGAGAVGAAHRHPRARLPLGEDLSTAVGRGNAEFLTVLGHRTARDLKPLLLQDPGDLRIAERSFLVFLADDLADLLLDRSRRDVVAVGRRDAAVKEVLHLEEPTGRVHVLVVDHAADRRLVHLDVL